MKKILIILLCLIGTVYGQTMTHQTIIDTTRSDGQRFIIKAPYENVMVHLVDSLTQINDSTWVVENGYISMINSTATFKVSRIRIIGSDTVSRGEVVTIPLFKIGNNAVQFLTGAATRKQVKKSTKDWINRKLNQE